MKSIIITGATNGIGKALVKALAQKGNFKIGIIGRNESKLVTLKKELGATGSQILTYKADLSLLKETKKAAEDIKNDFTDIHYLINNAGAYFSDRETTSENFEKTLATNYLSTVLLNDLLLPLVKATAQKDEGVKIINTGSIGHKKPINWDDLNFNEKYNGPYVYEHSKHLMISHTFDLANRLKNTGIKVNTIHPGFVKSGLIQGKKMPFPMNVLTKILPIFIGITPEKAAETYLWTLFSSEAQNLNGEYITGKKTGKAWGPTKDKAAQEKLRNKTMQMITDWTN